MLLHDGAMPFSLFAMIGCFAKAESREATVDENELAEVRWIERGLLPQLIAESRFQGWQVPRPITITHRMIKRFAFGEE
jgi:NAD+ diphosphatase